MVDLTNTGINSAQFRKEDGRCFVFGSPNSPVLECSARVEPEHPLHVQVAHAMGWTELALVDGKWWGVEPYAGMRIQVPSYDRSWCSLGPVIDRFKIGISSNSGWSAYSKGIVEHGSNACEAVAKLIVKLGTEGKL